jgi:hypothetical protein
MLAREGTADVNVDAREGGVFFVLDEFADPVAGWVIEDETEGALSGAVLGEEDHRMLKYALAQGRVGNEKLALETDGGFLLGNVGHGRTLARGRRAVKAEGGVREGKCELREGRRLGVGKGPRFWRCVLARVS